MKEIDGEILENTRVFHVGSLSLTDDPSRTATYEAINIARNSGAVISYDPNYRAALWSDPETAQLRMQSLIPYVDMMKISDEETSLLTPVSGPRGSDSVSAPSGRAPGGSDARKRWRTDRQ